MMIINLHQHITFKPNKQKTKHRFFRTYPSFLITKLPIYVPSSSINHQTSESRIPSSSHSQTRHPNLHPNPVNP
ncbi:hypothetical protein Hanom_Chr10g00937191 [Helianthus anomalus]